MHRAWIVVLATIGAVAGFAQRAAAQDREQRAAARDVALALANLIPAAEAARARSGRYEADVFPVAGGEAAVVGMVDVTEFGWNAIGIHRRVPGVTCTVRVGTAGPLLGGPSQGWDPWCIGPDARPVPPDLKPDDARRVRWWHDPFLESAPERKDCPALALPRAPRRNDTLYLSFLLDHDGRVVRAPVIVESSGTLVQASAALSWLARCRFTPAKANGRAVQSFVHLAYPLAASHPMPPDAEPGDDPAQPQALALERWYAAALARLLGGIATAQEARRAETGRYASTLAELETPRFISDSSVWSPSPRPRTRGPGSSPSGGRRPMSYAPCSSRTSPPRFDARPVGNLDRDRT